MTSSSYAVLTGAWWAGLVAGSLTDASGEQQRLHQWAEEQATSRQTRQSHVSNTTASFSFLALHACSLYDVALHCIHHILYIPVYLRLLVKVISIDDVPSSDVTMYSMRRSRINALVHYASDVQSVPWCYNTQVPCTSMLIYTVFVVH